MKVVSGVSKVLNSATRNIVSPALKSNLDVSERTLSIIGNEGGLQYACIPRPNVWNGLTRIMAVFNAGSRYEDTPHLHGLTHLLRRSCGISTTNYTAVNLTRHIQQMGGRLHCHTTREHMIYSVDVAPNLASRAGLILATMATRTAFYDWELKDQVYKLMHKDIDILYRRRFDALTIELLHEAAFGQHPDGLGLGNSLYANKYRVGSHTIEDIDNYLASHYTPDSTLFLVSGCGPNSDGVDICDSMREVAQLRSNSAAQARRAVKHTFVGGERRHEVTGAPSTFASLAWPTPGGHVSEVDTALVGSLFTAALAPVNHSVAYGSTGGYIPPSDGAVVFPIHFSYSDHGLFGFLVTGANGKVVGEALTNARSAIARLASTGLNEEQFERAKSRFKAELSMRLENFNSFTEDIVFQLMCGSGKSKSDLATVEDICHQVDTLQLSEANRLFATIIGSESMALSAVGTDTAYVPPLEVIRTA